MLCPVCGQALVIVEHRGVELDVCIDRHGVWFDAQELAALLTSIDAASARVEAEQLEPVPGQGKRRRCPRCRGRMDHVKPPDVKDLVLDRCRRGHGLWFDDGELRQILAARLGDGHPALAEVQRHLHAFVEEAPAAGAKEAGEE
jgi:Zn-finger nucleic acid-binding protein